MTAEGVISLLTDSDEESEEPEQISLPEQQHTDPSSGDKLLMSPSYKSCSLRAFNYMMSLELDHFVCTYLTESESILFTAIRNVIMMFPAAAKHLAVLLARKWPKWHILALEDPGDSLAIDALVSIGCVSTIESVTDWIGPIVDRRSWQDHHLMRDISQDSSHLKPLIDLLLHSLSPKLLAQLAGLTTQQFSRTATIAKIKTAYDGKQRTIFGDRNDIPKLVKTVSSKLDKSIALFLSPEARELFTVLSFILDIDSEDEDVWEMALPGTLLKTFANVSNGRRSPKLFLGSSWSFSQVPVDLRIFKSREEVDTHRVVSRLEYLVINRKVDPVVVARNARTVLADDVNLNDSVLQKPEWWRRRKLPRRLSNLIWKCNAEIERLKQYELATDHLRFLLENHEHLLGKKRLGKVLIRFMICSGHVSDDPDKVRTVVSKFLEEPNLYPADVAELTRRLAGVSINKFEWPCGGICEREVIIPGAKSREINWVEQAAIEHYYVTNDGGYEDGVHCEGRVMMQIFSALFNESVLAPSSVRTESGLLQSPLQKWALDIGFLKECSIERWEKALATIETFSMLDYDALADFYSTLNLDKEDDPNLQLPVIDILRCMRGNVLAAIMRLMIADPYYWGGGHPDLIVWNASKREVCFAEVKGPGDQLSPRQRWWLAHLRDAGATAEVCWVIDEPKKNSRRKENNHDDVVSKKRRKKKVDFPKDQESAGTASSANTSTVEVIEILISSQD